MRETSPSSPRDLRLVLYVASGALAGALYVVFDVMSEARLRDGTLTGAMAELHALVDHVSPVLVGMLLGIFVHYLRLRARLWQVESAEARARARLQKVERDQAVWVLAAAVLHELNNPLHAIGLLADELAEYEDDRERRVDLIERIRAQAERTRRHLDVLRTMRAGGEPDMQSLTLDGVIGALANDLAPVAARDGLVVDASGCDRGERPVHVTADPTYVRVILENLIDNSLAALREGGGARITIRVSEEESRAVVRVFDDGPDIDARVDSTLFEPLRSTKTHGLGLGLPIARALARAMRGDLSLERSRGKTFRLDLPLRAPE
jgi:signal transduction histidine kinase